MRYKVGQIFILQILTFSAFEVYAEYVLNFVHFQLQGAESPDPKGFQKLRADQKRLGITTRPPSYCKIYTTILQLCYQIIIKKSVANIILFIHSIMELYETGPNMYKILENYVSTNILAILTLYMRPFDDFQQYIYIKKIFIVIYHFCV